MQQGGEQRPVSGGEPDFLAVQLTLEDGVLLPKLSLAWCHANLYGRIEIDMHRHIALDLAA